MTLTSVTFASALTGQTLFAWPDTTPDYVSYSHIEDCKNAILRLTVIEEARNEPIWYDTAAFNARERHAVQLATSRRPDVAIQTGKVCLNKFDADTVQFWSVGGAQAIIDVLLMAHRDQDADRFAQRFLDSMRHKSAAQLKQALHMLVWVYGKARPVRLNEAKHYYPMWLLALKDDSLYHTIDAAMVMVEIAKSVADTASFEAAAWQAIRTNDATPVKERLASPGAKDRLGGLTSLLEELTYEEGLDSIAVSTSAYVLYEANTLKARVFGDEWRRTPETTQMSKYKIPDLIGEHYYTAAQGLSSDMTLQGLGSYTKKGAVPQGELPVRNRVNLIVRPGPYCHAESQGRRIGYKGSNWGGQAKACVAIYARLTRMKQRFPDLEFTILTNTLGTVGLLGPLKPADEADTLAKLFLGFHHVPDRLVIEETPFFHMADPDGRRIDTPTPYTILFKEQLGRSLNPYAWAIVIDKEGLMVNVPGGFESDVYNRFLDTLIKRTSK